MVMRVRYYDCGRDLYKQEELSERQLGIMRVHHGSRTRMLRRSYRKVWMIWGGDRET